MSSSLSNTADPQIQEIQPSLKIEYDPYVNYALQQNSIPVIKEIHFKNDGVARRNLSFKITPEPAFAAPLVIRHDGIDEFKEFRTSKIDLNLSHDYLNDLPEKITGLLNIEVICDQGPILSFKEPIHLFSKNEWCGLVSLPEILAAFVLPNDKAVQPVLRRASELLAEKTGRPDLNGYQDKNKKRVWYQVASIYTAIRELDIMYTNPMASFEDTGQKIRFPSDIHETKAGTCLDLSLLCAACCEQIGLRPLLFIHEGHCYAGCWLEERMLPEPAGDDLQYIRKLEADKLITVFEPTLMTNGSNARYSESENYAREHHLTTDIPFKLALDIKACRSARIRPLPIAGADIHLPYDDKPKIIDNDTGEPDFPITEIDIDHQSPQTPASRIDLWKKRLLDLTLRNRFLNFKETRATINILSADPEQVEDALAGNIELQLKPKPKLIDGDPRNMPLYSVEHSEKPLETFLREEFRQKILHTTLTDTEHSKRLTELYRATRNALEENGVNNLFVAVGILEWKEKETSDRVHRAPLLLLPVELKRKSVLEGFSLKRIDEETRLNVTLMEMLRHNFQMDLKGLEPLPEDESGVNVPVVIQIFRDAVRDLQGWEVKTELWLGQFSFTKFLLWKDLTDRLEDLKKNRVVKHLIDEADTLYDNQPGDILPNELDHRFPPHEVLCPRSADSSQLAAVMLADAGHDFVLEGPPGTGKSQTITNIIAHCLAKGKKVLFVAEKRAALDVVHRRLKEDGLEPFCLELHSNKTGKSEVLAQFDRCLKLAEERDPHEWNAMAREMEQLRKDLNRYTQILHHIYPCGLSAYRCFDYLLPRKDKNTITLDNWAPYTDTTVERLNQARELVNSIKDRATDVWPLHDHPLSLIAMETWGPSWEQELITRIFPLINDIGQAQETTDKLITWLSYTGPQSEDALFHLSLLTDSLLSPKPVGKAFATTPWSKLSQQLERWEALLEQKHKLRQALSSIYQPIREDSPKLSCEQWDDSHAAGIKQKVDNLIKLSQDVQQVIGNTTKWLGLENNRHSLQQIRHLLTLVSTLLESREIRLGSEYINTNAYQLETILANWVNLIKERNCLRNELNDYQESRLLEIKLDRCHDKWIRAKTNWAPLGFLRKALIRRQLKKANIRKVKPAADTIDRILEAAIRLREINHTLTNDLQGEPILGACWNGAEPDKAELQHAYEWSNTLQTALSGLSGEENEAFERLKSAIALPIYQTWQSPSQEKEINLMLTVFQNQVSQYLEDSGNLIETAQWNNENISISDSYIEDMERHCQHYLDEIEPLRKINQQLQEEQSSAENHLDLLWNKGEADPELIKQIFQWGKELHHAMAQCAGADLVWLQHLRELISSLFSEGPASYAGGTHIGDILQQYKQLWSKTRQAISAYTAFARIRSEQLKESPLYYDSLLRLLDQIRENQSQLRIWCMWQQKRAESEQLGLQELVHQIESSSSIENLNDIQSLFERSFRKALLYEIMENEKALREFIGSNQEKMIDRFRKLDDELSLVSRKVIREELFSKIPRDPSNISLTGSVRFDNSDIRANSKEEFPKKEMGLLKKEIGKKMRHIPVRQLIGKIPTLLPKLKPCMLMSPLSVAQYLEPAQNLFDVVIFDEASQIPVWDAVGAIARGRQLIVVGDPKQLPPTNFFNSNTDNSDDDDLTPDEYKDLESILDELMSHGLKHKRLKWHYRSRHEGLIAFSNQEYYQNDLLTFPSPHTEYGGVKLNYLADATFDRGKSRTNRKEAEALVRNLVERLRHEDGCYHSYGIVTFNIAQQRLIEDLLDEERRKYPEIEPHFGDSPPVEGEPVFVKNLENVQGDERDIIFFSIGYGKDEAGKTYMNFGPLNREGGERRLNVAITRAKHEICIFSGLLSKDIDLSRTKARGVRDLRLFLDYAERGNQALTASLSVDSNADADSEFESLVADRIRKLGYEVHHQVGCSGYRIDLAVVDPANKGRYLLGIECDGATYHSAATARDRDKLRQNILEGLGWRIHRIWSTDWWHSPDKEMDKLISTINGLLIKHAL